MMTTVQREQAREDIALILEEIAKNGLPHPRDLDVALDAIFCALETGDKAEADWMPAEEAPHGVTVEVRLPNPIHARLVGWDHKHWGLYAEGQYLGRSKVQPTHFRPLRDHDDIA